MSWRKKQLLIWGTTYPEFSKQYYETVCTGAIDAAGGSLMRVYPITLRYLDDRFKHYQWIEAEVLRNTADTRPESYKIQQDTIEIGKWLDPRTKGAWAERRQWVLREGNVFASFEDLREAQAQDGTSLGLIKPKHVNRISFARKTDRDREDWNASRDRATAQKDLFVDVDSKVRELQFVPVRYYVEFTTEGPSGEKTHKCAVLDWGVYVLHRRMFAQHGGGMAEEKVMTAIRSRLDTTKRDPYLFMGNTRAHPSNFSIVGFFSPPIETPKKPIGPDTLSLPGFEES